MTATLSLRESATGDPVVNSADHSRPVESSRTACRRRGRRAWLGGLRPGSARPCGRGGLAWVALQPLAGGGLGEAARDEQFDQDGSVAAVAVLPVEVFDDPTHEVRVVVDDVPAVDLLGKHR